MVSIKIDGIEIQTKAGTPVLETALQNGIYIPHLCHHPDLPPLGGCGLCLVEVNENTEPVQSCALPAEDGMCIRTSSERIEHLRKVAMELLMAAHPEHCNSCPKYGRCEMQLLIQKMDATAGQMHTRVKRFPVKTSKLLKHDMLRCILCGRCVRACHDLRGVGVLKYNKSDMEVYVGTLHDKLLTNTDCRFCGACAEVCPTGAITDLVEYTAVTKKEKLLPCTAACPAHSDIPSYIRYAKQGEYGKANAVIHEKLLFPESLGRVCNHNCELECRRGELNDAVSIREIKRVCAERDFELLWKKNASQNPDTGRKVCVVGGGPAGITAAVLLRKKGHSVDLMEAQSKLGGQLQYGIPAYRLPREIVDKETAYASEIGVNVLLEHPVRGIEELRRYDAALIAVGTQKGKRIKMKGSELPGTIVCTDFLRESAMGKMDCQGKKFCILGGGNVAFDCARSAVRLGAKAVYLVCNRRRDQIKADLEELEQSEEEGVELLMGHSFEEICGETEVEGVRIMEIQKLVYGENGARTIIPKPESERILDTDMVIFAVGLSTELDESWSISLNPNKTVALASKDSYETSQKGIFACGDAVTGTKSVVEAIAAARNAASEIDCYLGGDGNIEETLCQREAPSHIGTVENFSKLERQYPDVEPASERKHTFQEVCHGLCDQTQDECQRCLQCDLRFNITPARPWTAFQNRGGEA